MQDVGRCSMVCRNWNKVASDGEVWRQTLDRFQYLRPLDIFLADSLHPLLDPTTKEWIRFAESSKLRTMKQTSQADQGQGMIDWRGLCVSRFQVRIILEIQSIIIIPLVTLRVDTWFLFP
jgi:hypothetical protein